MNILNELRQGMRGAARIIMLAVAALLPAMSARADNPGLPGTNYLWLDYWDFADTTNWTTFLGYSPISFTNLSFSAVGNGNALVVDSTNAAWINYRVNETNGWTNLTADTGSVMCWVSGNWSGTNAGGAGPGVWGRILEAGTYTTNASLGWWSLYTDPGGGNIYFSAQTNGASTNYCVVPISWTNGQWHLLALTYSSTNTAFYIDGALVTNGPGMTIWPGTNTLTNGFFIGSDNTGTAQFHGSISALYTYNYPLDSNTIDAEFILSGIMYGAEPLFVTNLSPAPYTPSYLYSFDAVTGPGYLVDNGTGIVGSGCVTNSNVWITNVAAWKTNNGTMCLQFSILGGSNAVPYDVFATTALTGNYPSNSQWAWMGQGYQCHTYTLTNLPVNSPCFLILGQPYDADGDGLTTAYELLVSKTNPYGANTLGGVPDAWLAMHGYKSKLTSSLTLLDPDLDGLLNWQEYLWGTDPQVSEGFGVWVASPASVSGIP